MKSVQVLGERGMLGSAVVKVFTKAGWNIETHDIGIEHMWSAKVKAPLVINCAGIVKQRKDITPARMVEINAATPHRIAEACALVGSRLIQISTDCVFSSPGPHDESSIPSPTDLYSRSKLAGEVDVPHLTIRTSFVGEGKRGLVQELRSVTHYTAFRYQFWSGVTATYLAELLLILAEREDIQGLLHVPGYPMSRVYLAQTLVNHLRLKVGIEISDKPAPDRRLLSKRWEMFGLPRLKDFFQQLEEEWPQP